MKQRLKRTAACLSGLLAAGSLPVAAAPGAAEVETILATGFEDGDVSMFSKRGEDDTSVIGVTDKDVYAGEKCMEVSERSESWNGPSVSLKALGCQPGVQYLCSAMVKAEWYNTVCLSMQYTDTDGEQHYANLAKATSQGEWVKIPETKFSFSEDMKDVQIYFEGSGSDKVKLYVDDFALTTAPVYQIEQDIPGLKEVYADYFKIGCAVTSGELAPKSTKELILKHFNSVTLGNELKPENMLDQKATLAYLEETGDNTKPIVRLTGDARSILNFCRDNNIAVRGHVLVWHSQTPGWFFKEDYKLSGDWVDKATMSKRMEAYIKGVFEVLKEEYPTVNFYAWDVVNEAWTDGGTPREGGTYDENRDSSGWVKVWGDNSFIEEAFTYARKYAPSGCKLYYNDYNEYIDGKTQAMIKMATDLKAKNLIDGIGCQSHLNVTNYDSEEPYPQAVYYAKALKEFAKLGLDIQITELDATVSASKVSKPFELQAKYYSDIMDAIVECKDSISAVVFWGTTDDQSWRSEKFPLLFNEDYTAKPAFYSIIDGINYTTTASTATTSKTTETTTSSASQTTVDTPVPQLSKIRGDADGDFVVTLQDAVQLAKALAGIEGSELTAQGAINCNLDGKEGLSEGDLKLLLQYLAGILDKL